MKTPLPHETDAVFLTDGGLETTLIFQEGIELPHFAAFVLLKTQRGRAALRRYYRRYAELAKKHGAGLVLESPTWRASSDWGTRLGYSRESLIAANRDGIGLMHEIREQFESPRLPVIVSGCIGPRGDGYEPGAVMSAGAATDYHTLQARIYRDAGVDLISGFTINYVNEGLGIANAAALAETPSVISFTLETDGNLPTGESLREAIETVDAKAIAAPAYYMINCAHPTHFERIFDEEGDWVKRIRGIRANASCRSHAELNDSTDLDAGDPDELGFQYASLRAKIPNLNIYGGCCGTDHRHVNAMFEARTRAGLTLLAA
jgi:S-methylmethionine-dependent homocysteine/selenocysteine methylase